MCVLTPKISHYFIQNCCLYNYAVRKFHIIRDERLVLKMEGIANFSRRLQNVRNRNCSVFGGGVGTGGSGGSMNRGPDLMGPRVMGPQKNFRQDS